MIRPLLRSFTALAAAATLLAVVPAASAQTNNRHKLTRLGAVPASAMHAAAHERGESEAADGQQEDGGGLPQGDSSRPAWAAWRIAPSAR
jgi:hypothetical protein